MSRLLGSSVVAAALLVGTAAAAQAPDAGPPSGLVIEEFEPAASPLPGQIEPFGATSGPQVPRFFGEARAGFGVDTRFDSRPGDELPENVFELRGRARLGIDARLDERIRLLLEGRGAWRGVARRGLQHVKASFEPSLGEAFVDFYSRYVDVRVGQQILAFGANAALAPADALNPRDLREGFGTGEPEDAKIPVLAARALATVGPMEVLAAWAPFFTPSRYSVFGQDEALVQPALGAQVPAQLDASVEDELQPHLLETERPKAFPWLGEWGVRVRADVKRTQIGVSWVWTHEKLPAVRVDRELASLVSLRRQGREDPALGASVQNRLLAGERLWSGTYPRQHVLSLEGTRLVGSAQVDVDFSWTPLQTFESDALEPLQKGQVTWVFGLSQAEASKFTYSLSYLGLAVPHVAANELLFLLEPATARGAARTAWFHLLLGFASYKLLDERLEVSVRAGVEPIQRSFVLAPKVAWELTPDVSVSAGAELYEGKPYSPFGYFDRNDQLTVGVLVRLP